MKITWLSPHGDGWSIAAKLRDSGHRVVYWCADHQNKNGTNALPSIDAGKWLSYAERSDLVVVDGNFDSRPTRRSWEPSDVVRDLQQLRHRGVRVIGPTPTTELLENDPRYLRKFLRRAGLSMPASAVGGLVSAGDIRVTLSADPDGRCFLVFRHRELLGDGNGPELGNLGDVVVPLPVNSKLVNHCLKPIHEMLDRTSFSTYLNVELVATEADLHVRAVQGRFIYPAIFVQFPLLLGLGNEHGMDLGLAVTLLRLDNNSAAVSDDLGHTSGFFGRDVVLDQEGSERYRAVGPFVGAVIGQGATWNVVQNEVYSKLSAVTLPGWGYRPGVGSNVFNQLETLHSWGWL